MALALSVLMPAASHAQELLVNPGFETNSCPGGSGGCNFDGAVTGWTAGGNNSIDLTNTNWGPPHSGDWAANFYGSGTTMSQTVNLTRAGTYSFSFWYSLQDGGTNPGNMQASVGGTTVFNAVISNSTYQQFTTTLTLAAGAALVQFLSGAGTNETNIDDVSLTFAGANALSPSLPANAPANVSKVASAIDAFVNSGGTLPPGFQNLYNLTGDTLVAALQQLTGEAGATGGQQGGTQLTNSFLSLLLNGFTGGRGGTGGFGAATGYAAAPSLSPEAASAYAALDKAAGASRRLSDPNWTSWGSAYGGQSNAKGDAVAGTSDTRATTWGLAAGLDHRVSPSTVVGIAFAGGSTGWHLGNGAGGGRGEVFQTGVYASHQIGAAYVAAAATYAYHHMTTDRTVWVAGTDTLTAGFDAHNVGGRIEAGRRFAGPGASGITPYAAVQVQAFFLPSYSETATSGSNQFALAFGSRTTTTTRGELGAWFDTQQLTGTGPVKLFSRLAWAHDWRSDDSVTAAFQSLSGSSFVVNGATPPKDIGLVTAGFEGKAANAVTVVARFDGEFAQGYQSYAGSGGVRYAW